MLTSRRIAAVTLTLASFTLASFIASQHALAASATVEAACTQDYYAHCSKHDPIADKAGVNACMRSNGAKLSSRCVDALVADGQVSKSDLGKRSAKK